MINLKDIPYIDLLTLKQNLEREFKDRDNRAKHKIFKVHLLWHSPVTFLKYENAAKYMNELLSDPDVAESCKTDDDITLILSISFTDASELKWCHDYIIPQENDKLE